MDLDEFYCTISFQIWYSICAGKNIHTLKGKYSGDIRSKFIKQWCLKLREFTRFVIFDIVTDTLQFNLIWICNYIIKNSIQQYGRHWSSVIFIKAKMSQTHFVRFSYSLLTVIQPSQYMETKRLMSLYGTRFNSCRNVAFSCKVALKRKISSFNILLKTSEACSFVTAHKKEPSTIFIYKIWIQSYKISSRFLSVVRETLTNIWRVKPSILLPVQTMTPTLL